MSSRINRFVLAVSIILTLFESFNKASRSRFTTDFASFLLSGIGQSEGLGAPYTEIWGINPPGLLLTIDLWNQLFGHSLLSFHILYIILVFSILFITWKIFSFLFRLPISIISWVSFALILMNQIVLSQFFPSEVPGLFFLVTGLYFAIVSKNKNKLFLASFFMVFSFFVKDVFFAGLLCLIPQFFSEFKKLSSKLISVISGASMAVLLNIAYLIRSNALESYIEVVRIKRLTFNTVPKLFLENSIANFDKVLENYMMLPSWITILFLVTILILYLPRLKEIFRNNNKYFLTILLFFVGMLAGYSIQGRYNNKYDIPLILPSILMLSFWVNSLIKHKVVSTIALFILLLPNLVILNNQILRLSTYNLFDHVQKFRLFENKQLLEMEDYIKLNTTQSDCIIKIYGWGVADAYIYSKRRPCTRHFLTNILPESMKQEYRQEIIDSPPKAIIYTKYLTDTDIDRFEKKVFNFTQVISNCYYRDMIFEELYWSDLDINELSSCIEVHSLSSSR